MVFLLSAIPTKTQFIKKVGFDMNHLEIYKYMKRIKIIQLIGLSLLVVPTIIMFDMIFDFKLFEMTKKTEISLLMVSLILSLLCFLVMLTFIFKVNKSIRIKLKELNNLDNYTPTIDNPILELLLVVYFVTFKYQKLVYSYLDKNDSKFDQKVHS
jgi:hypothetical protein